MLHRLKDCSREVVLKIRGKDGRILWIRRGLKVENDFVIYITNILYIFY